MNLFWYVAVFFSALAVDTIPVFAPPAWPFMVFFLLKFDLNPIAVVLTGVAGSVVGRTILSLYMPHVSKKFLSSFEDDNLSFLGKQLDKSFVKTFAFVFIYSITPLSTTALFTAAGVAKAKFRNILPPFFFGKLTSDCVLMYTGMYAASNFDGVKDSLLSPKGIILSIVGILTFVFVLLIDWRQLIEKKKFSLKFKVWK